MRGPCEVGNGALAGSSIGAGLHQHGDDHLALAVGQGDHAGIVDDIADGAGYAAVANSPRTPAQRRAHIDAWNADPRDTASTAAIATLLQQVWQGRVLSDGSTNVLKQIMAQTRTGSGRLRGVLPPRTPVAHKTGTVGDVINDAGVITLPDGKGEVVVAVLMQSTADTAQRERTIADLARAAHDYFLFVE